LVAVVVVSYNSAEHLRSCVEPLSRSEGIDVVVVDNASRDGSVGTVADLPITVLPLGENRGFAAGCNAGWRASDAPFALFLNPDATIDPEAVLRLARVAEQPGLGAVAPKVLEPDGSIAPSQRRFPRAASTFGQALFLHRLFRGAAWSTELVHDPRAYERPAEPEWVSGACVLVRRDVLERLGGLDEGFFMYCEDKDLCHRIWDLGLAVRYEPGAVAVHRGGESAPRTALLPVLTSSRIRYARKHAGLLGELVERVGVGVWSLTHLVLSRGGAAARAGHARSLVVAGSPIRRDGGTRFVRPTALGEPTG
jgi:N-acetylglucosaminyl-diphospho-decaprenol L-rhamnosyltransferase